MGPNQTNSPLFPFQTANLAFNDPNAAEVLHLDMQPQAMTTATPQNPLGIPAPVTKVLAGFCTGPNSAIERMCPTIQAGYRVWVDPGPVAVPGLTPAENGAFRTAILDAVSLGQIPLPQALANEIRPFILIGMRDRRQAGAVMAALRSLPGVASVEKANVPLLPDVRTSPLPPSGGAPLKGTSQGMPDWMYGTMKRPAAWDRLALENIAILDSGVDANHPALLNAVELAPSSYAVLRGPDSYGHGTHVASLIAGRPTTPIVAFGAPMAPGALPMSKPLCLNIFRANSKALDLASAFITALSLICTAAYRTRIRVVNMSIWMADPPSPQLSARLNACEANGIVLVACSGNNFGSTSAANAAGKAVYFPARLPKVLSVGAVEATPQLSAFSRYSTAGNDPDYAKAGKSPLVDLVAPGEMIWGAAPKTCWFVTNNQANFKNLNDCCAMLLNGTSMATPYVTAALAVLVDKKKYSPNPAGAAQGRSDIKQCVQALGSASADQRGAGLLDASRV